MRLLPRGSRLPAGWMGGGPLAWLRHQARERGRIIEVGAWKGRSTMAMAREMGPNALLYAVDHWRGTPEDPEQHARAYTEADESGDRIFRQFHHNLGFWIRGGRVIPVRRPSAEAAPYLLATRGAVFDFIFLDADHSYEGVKADILAFSPLLAYRGRLAGHDYGGSWPGVKQAVDELLPGFQRGPGSIWWRDRP